MKRVLSGIRATGKLHFGSLLGAVNNFVKFQEDKDTECLYFIADYHTLTTLDDPEQMRANLIEMVKDYLAAGLDPEKSIIYAQSSVPKIAELALYLSMIQPLGDLERTPTFKDMVRRFPDRVSLGLVTYPVLMAADILGPKSVLVPVGKDQEPNVEMARDLARRFNSRYQRDVFVIPDMLEDMVKVTGLSGGKMGKSDADNAIGISMSKEEIFERYKRSGMTDPKRVRGSDPGNPDECISVYPTHRLVTRSESAVAEVATGSIADKCRSGQIGCVDCKRLLAESLYGILGPFQERRAFYDDKDELVREILHEGGKKARAIIDPTVEEVADCMGITRF